MVDGKLIICDTCKQSVPINDVRYVQKAEDTLVVQCNSCRTAELMKKTNPGRISATIRVPERRASDKKLYFCEKCRYKFRHDPNARSYLQCPYCGKGERVVPYKETSADDLIDRF